MAEIGRLLTAMVTPFDADLRVDYVQARKLAKALVDSGSDGLVVSGTTGECPTLTTDEKLRLFAEVKAAVGNSAAVIAGTTNYNTAESIEITREAEGLGVDGILATVPYYNKPPQEGLYQHFKAIAASTKLPVILYNVPSRTSLNMAAETTLRLSQIDNIAGVKEASSNFDQIARIVDGARDSFKVWSGNDNDTLPMLSIGCYGVISVASHFIGAQIQEMIRAHVAGDVKKAAALHRKLLPVFGIIFIVTNPIPTKYYLNKLGLQVGEPRLPLVSMDAKSAAALDAVMGNFHMDIAKAAQLA